MRIVRGMRWITAAAATLAIAGGWQFAQAGYIQAKAVVAQQLIASAWHDAQEGRTPRRPWPWADMRPIARLTVPARGIDVYVLDDASMRALAFGPAHVSGTAALGSAGNAVLIAHRDTHFSFLRRLAVDDVIEVETADRGLARYRVVEASVIDKHDTRVMDAGAAQLTLITCYPFNGVRPGTVLRYVVVAERIEESHLKGTDRRLRA